MSRNINKKKYNQHHNVLHMNLCINILNIFKGLKWLFDNMNTF